MLALKRTPCPICNALGHKYHCNSPYCQWFVCSKCYIQIGATVVFNEKEKYFLRKGD